MSEFFQQRKTDQNYLVLIRSSFDSQPVVPVNVKNVSKAGLPWNPSSSLDVIQLGLAHLCKCPTLVKQTSVLWVHRQFCVEWPTSYWWLVWCNIHVRIKAFVAAGLLHCSKCNYGLSIR